MGFFYEIFHLLDCCFLVPQGMLVEFLCLRNYEISFKVLFPTGNCWLLFYNICNLENISQDFRHIAAIAVKV